MIRLVRLVVVASLLSTVAGCLATDRAPDVGPTAESRDAVNATSTDPGPGGADTGKDPQSRSHVDNTTRDRGSSVASYERLTPDGAQARAFVDSFATSIPQRWGSMPGREAARTYLEDALSSFGLEVERHTYDTGVNIVATSPGASDPGGWVVLSAHYDSFEGSYYGAWDDGSGVAVVLELARTLSTHPWDHTLAFVFFDEEEAGFLGSKAFVEERVIEDGRRVVAALNFDPPGLNWPCENPDGSTLPVTVLRGDENNTGQASLERAVVAGALFAGVPDHAIEMYRGPMPIVWIYKGGAGGTSDHESFDLAGIANVFVGGGATVRAPVAPVAVMSYPMHTPLDAIEAIELRCGGADLLVQAFQTILDLALHSLGQLEGSAS